MKTLLKNCAILIKADGAYKILKNAFLGVDGATICYIGTVMPESKYHIVKDYSNKLLIPGLYNCHTHSPMVLMRGIGNDLPLEEWLHNCIFPIESRLTAEDIENASYLAIMEMLASGIVSFTDMYFYPEVTAEAVAESGIKANLTKHIQFAENNPQAINDSLEFVRKCNGAADGRILTDFGIHSCYTCSKSVAQEYTALCNEAGGRLHIHLSETRKEYDDCLGKYHLTPTEWFDKIGALHAKTIAAHCVSLNENDQTLLAKNKVNVVHCPTSNLKLGSGFAPIPELSEKGVNITLGTDGAASNNNLNMWEEMHLAATVHNGRLLNSTVMDAETVIDMATVNGAKLQGRPDCGELKIGNRADIVAIDLNKAHLWCPDINISLLTYSVQAADVCMTMADGKILYENGEYTTIDRDKIFRKLNP